MQNIINSTTINNRTLKHLHRTPEPGTRNLEPRNLETWRRLAATAVTLLVFLVGPRMVYTQVDPMLQQQAQSEIARRGVDEAAVRAKLIGRGIDIDKVQPSQLPALQPILEEVIKEVEAEQAKKLENTGGTDQTITKKSKTTTTAVNKKSAQSAGLKQGKNPAETTGKGGAGKKNSLMDTMGIDSLGPKKSEPEQRYGQHLFRDKSLSVFDAVNEVKVPNSYVLATGDVLTISIFGVSQFDSQFEINEEGYIHPTQMPKIFLKGVALGQARDLLRSRFSQFYRFAPEQFAVSLTTTRTISVNVFGETVNSGTFTLSALNTAFNALVAAGGPSDIGSVRQIKVIRGKQTKILDVYAFMNNPAMQYDFFLEDNDVIYVPVAERVVSVSGAVRRPFRFELIAGEHLMQLLPYAGGLNADAYREVIQVRRFVQDKQVLMDVNLRKLEEGKENFTLLDGDEIVVRAIETPIQNTAMIEGAVELPGGYALEETPRASDLIRKGGLKRTSRKDLAFLLRKNTDGSSRLIQLNMADLLSRPGTPDDILLEPGDLITVYEQERYTDLTTISISGAVREPVVDYPFSRDSSITIQRAILLAGGLRPDANGSGYIVRTDPQNSKLKTYLSVNIQQAFNLPESGSNVVLEPFDELNVFSSLSYTDVADVHIVGAVREPGKFQYSPSLTLKDVLLLAGGLRMEAATNRIDVYRVEFKNNESTRTMAISTEVDRNYNIMGGGSSFMLQPFDEIVVRSVPDFEFQKFVEVNGEVRYPGRYALTSDNETLSSVIQRAGGLTGEADPSACTLFRDENKKGFVVTRLDEALRHRGSSEDHILKGDDVINVPKQENLVTIRGGNTELSQILSSRKADSTQINVAYNQGKRARWYVREYAGGFSKDANRRKVTVEAPNGKISRTRHLLVFNLYPKVTQGAVIYVPSRPTKAEKSHKDKKEVDWDKKLTQLIAFTSMVTSSILAYATIKSIQ